MSILQEYEAIRARIGEAEYKRIEKYLRSHPGKLLSDIYYNEAEHKKARAWIDAHAQ